MTRTKLAAILLAALATQACGGDEGGGGDPADKAAKKAEADKKKKEKEAKKKAAKKKREEPVSYISALEDVVRDLVDKDGKPLVKRPRLTNHDFMATENRDPFRSFVMPQVASDDNSTTGPVVPTGPVAQPTAACAKLELVATNYAIDDLDLIGVIRKGSRRYAMFRDSRGVGHLVDKGKCLGREKGKIVEVGDSLVCYEVTPEQPADATAVTPPVKKCVALYPNEITDTGEEEIDLSARPDDLAPPTPPASDPSTTPGPPPGPPTSGPPGGPP